MTSVRAGGLVFQGGAGSRGFFIADRGLEGLRGGVGVRSDVVARSEADGEFSLPSYRAGRLVTVTGQCLASSAAELSHFGDQLAGLFAESNKGRVTFDMPNGVMWGDARLADEVKFEPVVWDSYARFMVQFRFPDPRLYGEQRASSGGVGVAVPAYHFGNYNARPELTVAGTFASGYTVTGPGGRTFTVTTAVTAGNPHVISLADGYVRVNGAVLTSGVTSADVWTVGPGQTVSQTLTAASGSGSLAVSVLDTFI